MKIEAKVKPTEKPEKLKKAILKVFPDAELDFNEQENKFKGETSFKEFWEKVEEQKIRDSILEVLKKNKKNKRTYIDISKTTAASGKLSTYVGSSLGKIHLVIDWEEADQVIQEFN